MSEQRTDAAIRRLLMMTASHASPEEIHDALEAGFGEPDAMRALAEHLAEAIAEKLPWTPLAFSLDTAPELVAFLMVRRRHLGQFDGHEDLLDPLESWQTASVAGALLAMWREACDEAARIALQKTTIPTDLEQEHP